MEIKKIGDKVLTQKAKRVSKIDDIIRNLCVSMMNTMIENNGVGLSGNQVGVLKRIIIIKDGEDVKIMINPEIVEFSDAICDMKEGCLSIPDTFLDIKRPEKIEIKYRDTKGKPHFETYSGLTSRIIQHEMDHLDGIVMVNK
jgi:peptide deformylase